MTIYVAKGDETLGPFTPEEAANLVNHGYLQPDDFAAREGDADWVELLTFLPAELPETAATALREANRTLPASTACPTVRHGRPITLVLVGLILVAAALWMTSTRRGRQPAGHKAVATVTAKPAPGATTARLAKSATPVAATPPPPTPPQEPDGHLSGTVVLAGADGVAAGLPGVRVRVYPLPTLEPYIAQKQAAAQPEIARLTPSVDQAEAEMNARVQAARMAHLTWQQADPSDVQYSSLQFADAQAKTTAQNAETDWRYYVDQRRAVTGGEYYFADLPPAPVDVETDADGGFTATLHSREPCVVAASARQGTADGYRPRYWLVKVSFAATSRQTVRLTDENTTSGPAADSLTKTED